jgi:hypothetical protein
MQGIQHAHLRITGVSRAHCFCADVFYGAGGSGSWVGGGDGVRAVCAVVAVWGKWDGDFDDGDADDSFASRSCMRSRSRSAASSANRSGDYATCGIVPSHAAEKPPYE